MIDCMKKSLPSKTLLLVAWYPWVGKTYLSKEIVKNMHFTYVDKDEINDVFSESRISSAYKKSRDTSYKLLYWMAKSNLEVENSVLLDAPFSSSKLWNDEWVTWIKNFAERNNAIIKIIRCIADIETRKQRILSRNHMRDQERKDELDEFLLQEKRFDIPFSHIVYDTVNGTFSDIELFLLNP